jgi:hypothetical protein
MLGPEETALLQLRNRYRADAVEPVRQGRGMDRESIGAVAVEPALPLVGDLARGLLVRRGSTD